ncbi:MAG: ApbE family protein [Woeseiaceae bacterium]|nr:ApbE family protein [Woeseiaceae bacterium]
MTVLGTILVTFAVMLVVIAGMAIGVMNGRKPISGSCGGLNGGSCELCGSGKCQRESEE